MTVANRNGADDADMIRALVARWAGAVCAGDLAGVLAYPPDDVVLFDLASPREARRGLDAYRDAWSAILGSSGPCDSFELVSPDVSTGGEVAYAHALVRYGTDTGVPHAAARERLVRLTLGLRREHGRWAIAHEHQSFADGGIPGAPSGNGAHRAKRNLSFPDRSALVRTLDEIDRLPS